jgi:alpha-glucosidase (family GH31 glycosyl hydrolase)
MSRTRTALPTLPADPVADPRAVVRGDTYRITVLTDGLLRLEHAPDGSFEDRASAFALHRRLDVPDFRVTDTGTHLILTTSRLRLTYDKGPFSTSGLAVEVLGGITTYHSVWRYGQPAPNLGGTARTLDMADGPVPLEPGVVALEGFAVLDDSDSLLWDADGWVSPRNGERPDLYVFAYGRDHAEAVRALYAVSGRTPVLPRWALGNWWSRYHAYTAGEYLALLDRFAAQGIPFSVAVLDMDWHLRDVDPRYGSGWTGYTWNRELFPDPRAFLREMRRRGLRVTLNVHPADGVQPYEEAYPEMARALGRDPEDGDPVAFDVTDREFLTAYFEVLHRRLEQDGVDFWWIDWQSGMYSRVPGIDPLWMLNHFHYLDNARDGRRPLTFSRYAGPGSTGIRSASRATPSSRGRRWSSSRTSRRLRPTSATAGGAMTSAATSSGARTTSWRHAGCSWARSRRSCGCTPRTTRSSRRSRGPSGRRRGRSRPGTCGCGTGSCRTCTP